MNLAQLNSCRPVQDGAGDDASVHHRCGAVLEAAFHIWRQTAFEYSWCHCSAAAGICRQPCQGEGTLREVRTLHIFAAGPSCSSSVACALFDVLQVGLKHFIVPVQLSVRELRKTDHPNVIILWLGTISR
jgi:hypothetical protein